MTNRPERVYYFAMGKAPSTIFHNGYTFHLVKDTLTPGRKVYSLCEADFKIKLDEIMARRVGPVEVARRGYRGGVPFALTREEYQELDQWRQALTDEANRAYPVPVVPPRVKWKTPGL